MTSIRTCLKRVVKRGLPALNGRRGVLLAACLILLVAVALRCAYWRQYCALPVGRVALGTDAAEYDTWARHILLCGPLREHTGNHAPLYPLALAGMYRLGGVRISVVRALQLALDALSLLLVSGALWRLIGARCALVCAGLWAVYQPLIYYSAEILNEGLSVFFLSSSLFCWAVAHRPGGRGPLKAWPLLLSAALCGFAVLAHPLTVFLAVPYIAYATWRLWRDGSGHWQVCRSVLLPLSAVLPILPVAAWNHAVNGEWIPLQGNEGLQFFVGNNPAATGTFYLRPGPAYDRLAQSPENEGVASSSRAENSLPGRVLHFVAAQPGKAASLLLRKALLTWNAADITSGPDLPEMQVLTPFMRLPLLRFGMLAPLALAGWLWWRRPHLTPFLWAPLWGTLALSLFVTSGRYRLPMTPAIIASAALGVEALIRCWRRDDQRRAIGASLLALLGLGVAHATPVPAIPSSRTESVLLMAEASWQLGQRHEAAALLRGGLDETPGSAAMHHLLGNVLAAEGHLGPAVGALQEAINLEPGRTDALVDMSVALARLGLREDAAMAMRRALEQDPPNAHAWYGLGVIHENNEHPADAETAYRRALATAPTHARARQNLSVLLHTSGRADEARVLYLDLLRLRPRDDKALTGLAVYHAQLGHFPEARALLEKAMAASPRRNDLRQTYEALLLPEGPTPPSPAPGTTTTPVAGDTEK